MNGFRSVLLDIDANFWSKVRIGTYDECWLWQAGTSSSRGERQYGMYWWGARMVQAHRIAFYLIHDRWPEPIALHGCNEKLCQNAINPEHVHDGTFAENWKDAHDHNGLHGWEIYNASRGW